MDNDTKQLPEAAFTGVEVYNKSNFLINSSYKSTLLEAKILALSLFYITKLPNGELVSRIPASVIKQHIKTNVSGSFYDTLFETASAMTSKQYVMQEPGKGFEITNIIRQAKYNKGGDSCFVVQWEEKLQEKLYDIKSNYTRLSIETTCLWKSVYSLRLFELLRSRAYHPKGTASDSNVFKIIFSVAELRLNLGVVNSGLDKVQKVLVPKGGPVTKPDYEKAVAVSPEKLFESWSEFKRNVIDKAVTEINDMTDRGLSDMSVSYEPVKSGRGGKVVSVSFLVTVKSKLSEREEEMAEQVEGQVEKSDEAGLNTIEVDDVLEKISELITEPVKYKDLIAIAKAGDYDFDRVSRAYAFVKNKPGAKDLVAYMIGALQNEWYDSEPIEVKTEKKYKGTRSAQLYNDSYSHRVYTDEEMKEVEKGLLAAAHRHFSNE